MNRPLILVILSLTLVAVGATVAASQQGAWQITAATSTVEAEHIVLRTTIQNPRSFGELSWRQDTDDRVNALYISASNLGSSTSIRQNGEEVDCPGIATTFDSSNGQEEWTTTIPAGCIQAGTYPMLVQRTNIEGGDTSNVFGPVDLISPGGDIPEPTFEPATIERLAGASRYETAVEVSRFAFPNGAFRLTLANANVQVDALPGAKLSGGPILYVPADGPVPQVVLDEVARLNPTEVIVLGGVLAVSDDVAAQVQAQTSHRVD